MCVREKKIQADRQTERVREGRVRKKTEGGLFIQEDREREKIHIYTCFISWGKNTSFKVAAKTMTD